MYQFVIIFFLILHLSLYICVMRQEISIWFLYLFY